MGLRVYLELCWKYGVKSADVWNKKVPDEEVGVSEDGNMEIWWDRSVETTQKMEKNLPDFIVVDRAAQGFLGVLG